VVRVSSRTLDGVGVLDTSWAFDVEDRTSPALVAAFAPTPRQLELQFDEPVAVSPTSAVRLIPETTPAVTPRTTSLVSSGARVRAALDRPLSVGARYRVEVAGVADGAGNMVAPPFDRAWVAMASSPAPSLRFALWPMIPVHIRRSDESHDLARVVACLQDVTEVLLHEGDRWTDILDPRRAPDAFLDLMLADLGNPFPFDLDRIEKQRLVATLVQLYRKKGTAPGIEQALRFFFGLNARTRPYASRAARLGRARLGRDFRLGPSDQFRLYAFDLEVDRILSEDERRRVRWLVEYAKPAHTHLVQIIEPGPPVPAAVWRVGSGRLRQNTVLSTT
jgi:phage tail-like protein